MEFPAFDIHLRTLKNKQQFSDDDKVSEKAGINSTLWPIFGVIWEAGEILAHLMCSQDINNKRILEVGCGIGLSSLVLNKRLADITATDYHPEARSFLEANFALNHGRSIPFYLSNWTETNTELGVFDLIIGSDLLYQKNHPEALASFINRHAKQNATIILVCPNRGYQAKFDTRMEALHYHHEKSAPKSITSAGTFKGHIHSYKKQ